MRESRPTRGRCRSDVAHTFVPDGVSPCMFVIVLSTNGANEAAVAEFGAPTVCHNATFALSYRTRLPSVWTIR